ncbi:tRNA lysidine(34) synthetase TilS [Sulfurovum riftiae]|uniref:tRNA(Ile)-lysidine synthase n=1 Tax=Sulfurovum riftiae TaxID=1630136 RepID=A0A151CF13_9BACT|nr:tRNA lysidine(34) synthetase TilS [Sulfurovum riftiae]KYJ86111.1 tRNA(Ile)-lysidine synthetase [Sulfurovum riftiae]
MSQLLLPTSYFLLQKKNLLAFSAGIDSSALFFLLLENNIPFDIALVNYGTRPESNKEEEHAKALAKKYGKKCYTTKAPVFKTHFEANARKFRYDFFETLIAEHGYDTLLTAHQLNDQLEWLFMRLTKGAGLSELIGLEPVSKRDGYTLIRPLLEYSKEELLDYLEIHNYPYFIDDSNSNEKYERNRFRKAFSDPLISQFREGIKRSFSYLRDDKKLLESGFETLFAEKQLRIIKLRQTSSKVKAADLTLKKLGYLLSSAQREEIAREKSLVIGGEWAIEIEDDLLYVAPYVTTDMPKEFKEKCRVKRIPPKIRAYLYRENIDLTILP